MTLGAHSVAGVLMLAIGPLAILNGVRGVMRGLGADLSDPTDDSPAAGSQRTIGVLWDLALRGIGIPCGLWLMYRGVSVLME